MQECPPSTEEQAVLSRLGSREGVTLRIYTRPVEAQEQRTIIQAATRRNKLLRGGERRAEACSGRREASRTWRSC